MKIWLLAFVFLTSCAGARKRPGVYDSGPVSVSNLEEVDFAAGYFVARSFYNSSDVYEVRMVPKEENRSELEILSLKFSDGKKVRNCPGHASLNKSVIAMHVSCSATEEFHFAFDLKTEDVKAIGRGLVAEMIDESGSVTGTYNVRMQKQPVYRPGAGGK